MEYMDHFSIPFKGLNDGDHKFQFEVEKVFFQHFKNDVVKDGTLQVILNLEKRPGISVLEFSIGGTIHSECDRCMEPINLPISGEYRLLLKFGEEESNEEVMYVDPDVSILNFGQMIYEYIILSIPMIKTYNCEEEDPRPCNMAILDKLEEDHKKDSDTSGIWDSLKGMKFENN